MTHVPHTNPDSPNKGGSTAQDPAFETAAAKGQSGPPTFLEPMAYQMKVTMKDKDSPGSFGSLETGRTSVEAVAVSGAAPQSEESGRAWDSEGQCWVYPADVQEALAKAIEAAKLLYGEPEYTYYRQRVTWHPRDKTHFVPVAPNGHEPITREEWEKNAAQAAVNETERFMGRLKQTYYRYERKQVAPAWREKLVEAIPKYPE